MAGIGSVIVKKKKKKAGTFFSDRNLKPKRGIPLKKGTGIRNSAGIHGIPIGFPNQAKKGRKRKKRDYSSSSDSDSE